jgi:cytochrome c
MTRRCLSLCHVGVALTLVLSCARGDDERAVRLTGGNPDRGEVAIQRFGCGSCHAIAGIPGAIGRVGPELTGVSTRAYIAGALPNTPENMRAWVQHPSRFRHPTAMPELGVGEREGRDIVAYLYSLR